MCISYLVTGHSSVVSFVSNLIYEGRSRINASYFIMLAHDIRGRCW